MIQVGGTDVVKHPKRLRKAGTSMQHPYLQKPRAIAANLKPYSSRHSVFVPLNETEDNLSHRSNDKYHSIDQVRTAKTSMDDHMTMA